MASDDTTITIDGPAGSGKTTVARRLAQRLGYRFLDTGAMYRVASLAALRAGAVRKTERGVEVTGELVAVVERAAIDLREDGAVRIARTVVGPEIRTPEVTEVVSAVSAVQGVRDVLTAQQREFGARAEPGLVAEGRDMATVVFPTASLRFYLDASVEVRARRRLGERDAHGAPLHPGETLETMSAKVVARDERDAGRTVAPLRIGPGVEVVDTSELGIDDVVARLAAAVARGNA